MKFSMFFFRVKRKKIPLCVTNNVFLITFIWQVGLHTFRFTVWYLNSKLRDQTSAGQNCSKLLLVLGTSTPSLQNCFLINYYNFSFIVALYCVTWADWLYIQTIWTKWKRLLLYGNDNLLNNFQTMHSVCPKCLENDLSFWLFFIFTLPLSWDLLFKAWIRKFATNNKKVHLHERFTFWTNRNNSIPCLVIGSFAMEELQILSLTLLTNVFRLFA